MKKKYPGLDFVRFFAALIVAIYHLSYYRWHSDENKAFFKELAGVGSMFSAGWVGVAIFFVISGFVIAFSASERTAAQFIKSRMARLYPTAWICASLTVFVMIGDPNLIQKYLMSITIMPLGPWVDSAYWTLPVEIAFYSIVAVVLLMSDGNRLTQVGLTLGSVSSFFWLARLVDFATGRHFQPFFNFFDKPLGGLLLLTNGCFFALGMLLWSIERNGFSKGKLGIILICALAGLISIVAGARYKFFSGESGQIDIVVAPLVWVSAICVIAASAFWNDALSQFTANWQAQIRRAGLATYPLYLIHDNIGVAIMNKFQNLGGPIALTIALAFVICASFIVSNLEKYPRRWLLASLSRLPSQQNPTEVFTKQISKS